MTRTVLPSREHSEVLWWDKNSRERKKLQPEYTPFDKITRIKDKKDWTRKLFLILRVFLELSLWHLDWKKKKNWFLFGLTNDITTSLSRKYKWIQLLYGEQRKWNFFYQGTQICWILQNHNVQFYVFKKIQVYICNHLLLLSEKKKSVINQRPLSPGKTQQIWTVWRVVWRIVRLCILTGERSRQSYCSCFALLLQTGTKDTESML